MLKSGIYGLFQLDGVPVATADAAALGLAISGQPGPVLAQGTDRTPSAVHRLEDEDGLTILVGDLEEREDLGSRLNLAQPLPPAALARAALRRFGSDTPNTMIGEWSLLHWERPGQLTLMLSAARRDRFFYAVFGNRVAVAPDLFRLSRISWIGNKIDESGLLFELGRANLRAKLGDRTMLTGVHQLTAATRVVINAGGIRQGAADVFIPQPPWTGSFNDAMTEAEHLLRHIMRGRMEQTAVPAALLSGGLDSSILSWLAAEERRADQKLFFLTSVAPPGSGLPDESRFADLVAHRLDLECEKVAPPEDANIYRPPEHILGGQSGPPMGSRHCLTETFQRVGRALGATQLFDGVQGELTVTGPWPLATVRYRLRRAASRFRSGILEAFSGLPALGQFHVRIAPHRLEKLPEPVRSAAGITPAPLVERGPDDLWGYMPSADKALQHPNEFYPGALRMELPYRDLRLLRLFASFPANFLIRNGLNRAPARHMLIGRLPDSIRLRRSGLPASPDHLVRLKRQAPLARARIGVFRSAGVQDWLDLDWLDDALARVATAGPKDYTDANEVQLTAMTAEFLTWWHSRS